MERLHKVCNGARLSAAEFAKRWRNWSASAGLRAVTSATIAEFESLLIGVPPVVLGLRAHRALARQLRL